jgi:hypothetical protein
MDRLSSHLSILLNNKLFVHRQADRLVCAPHLEHLSYYSSRAYDVKVRQVFYSPG